MWVAILIISIFFVGYYYIVAFALGLHVMPIMDFNTFMTNTKAPVNIVTSTPVTNASYKRGIEVFSVMAKAHIKARSRIVKVLGDMYYQELDLDDVMKTQVVLLPENHLKSKEDLEKFMSENISKPMPLDRPQWMVWI